MEENSEHKRKATEEEKPILNSVRKHIRDDGRKQKDIAEKSGIPEGSISSYANRQAVISTVNAVKLADALNVSIDDLLGHKPPSSLNSLLDLLSAIFKIDEVLSLKYENGSLKFNEPAVAKRLEEWQAIKSLPLGDEAKNNILDGWKKGLYEDSKKMIVYGYQSAEEWADKLVNDFHLTDPKNGGLIESGYQNHVLDFWNDFKNRDLKEVPKEVADLVVLKLNETLLEADPPFELSL